MVYATRCLGCGRSQEEEAGAACRNPGWHDSQSVEATTHYRRPCEVDGHCKCFEDGLRCCTCRDRKL